MSLSTTRRWTSAARAAHWMNTIVVAAACATACGRPDDSTVAPPPSDPSTATRSAITLITGDRVTIAKNGAIAIAAGPGRATMTFVQSKDGDHTSVFPSDVLPLLHAGVLDPRLFDVTQLIEDKLDHLPYVPLIIQHEHAPTARTAIAPLLGTTTRVVGTFASIDAVAVRAETSGELWRTLRAGPLQRLPAGISRIWLDGILRPTLDVSVPLIGAPQAWAAGFDGTGVTVAVLDTGVDATHPDLADRVIGEMNFVAGLPIFDEDARDHVGHGTHVASTIAGSGAASQGRYRGVAPGAHLLDGKVCSDLGCPQSAILAGMEWAAASGAKVINMSFGGTDQPGRDPIEEAVDRLSADRGVLFVIAAGNVGRPGSVSSPGTADAALTVAAFDKSDRLAVFSSRGPRSDGGLKPEIAGPGVSITAARSKDSGLSGDKYTTLSGTSMATPHVAGSAAILAQQHPTATAAQLKALLIASAKPNPAVDVNAQGAGRVDVARGIRQTITAEPSQFSCGIQRFPHGDDVPVVQTVTYHNAGTADVTLALATRTPTGVTPGMFTLSAPTVTVPAGGAASVDVTCDTRVDGPVGAIGVDLTASSGDTLVQTPFTVVREEESYDLRITGTSRSGGTPALIFAGIRRTEPGQRAQATVFGDATTVRLPKGNYVIHSQVAEELDDFGAALAATHLVQPPFDLAADRTIDLDARVGRPIVVSLPDPGATRIVAETDSLYFRTDGTGFGIGAQFGTDGFCGQLGEPTDVPGLQFFIAERWAKADGNGTFEDSPFAYSLVWSFEDRVPSGIVRHLRPRDLATLRQHYAVQQAGNRGVSGMAYSPIATDPQIVASQFAVPAEIGFALPSSRTEYLNVDGSVLWSPYFNEVRDDGEFVAQLQDPSQVFPAGRAIEQRWNTAVFGPTVAVEQSAMRFEDELDVFLPWFADPFGRLGFTSDSAHRIALFQDGVPVPDVGIEGIFEVPPERGHYRLELEYTRGLTDLPTSEVRAAWTFDSENVPQAALPLSSISFRPHLDDQQAAPAGLPFLVPLVVFTAPGSNAGPLHRPRLEVSYDDGATWQPAIVVGPPQAAVGLIFHPRNAPWVSFHVHADGDDGGSVDETVIHAYRLR